MFDQESISKPESVERPLNEGLSSSVLFAKVLARLDQLTMEVAHLTQHTVPCTRKNGEQPYKCAYHPTHKWTGYLCPDHAKRVGKPHRDLHLTNNTMSCTAPKEKL
jgi:hypothetical protein